MGEGEREPLADTEALKLGLGVPVLLRQGEEDAQGVGDRLPVMLPEEVTVREAVSSAVGLLDAQPEAEGEGVTERVGCILEGEAVELELVLPVAELRGVAVMEGEMVGLPVSALDLLGVAGGDGLSGALALAHADARGVAEPQAESAPVALDLPVPLP